VRSTLDGRASQLQPVDDGPAPQDALSEDRELDRSAHDVRRDVCVDLDRGATPVAGSGVEVLRALDSAVNPTRVPSVPTRNSSTASDGASGRLSFLGAPLPFTATV
jgi:hypothetical protein